MSKVYFLKCAERIKVGTTADVEFRTRSIAQDAPFDVTVIAWVEGGFDLEQDILAALEPYRVLRKEWFADCPGVRAVIDDVVAGRFRLGPDASDQGSRLRVLIARIRARWGRRSASEIMRLTGASQRAAYNWLSGECDMNGEAALCLMEALDLLDDAEALSAA
jgi:hypothetical protein